MKSETVLTKKVTEATVEQGGRNDAAAVKGKCTGVITTIRDDGACNRGRHRVGIGGRVRECCVSYALRVS